MADLYREPLAQVHHEGFGDFARGSAAGIRRILENAGVRSGLVVDLGCGSGIWAGILCRAGYSVLGVDGSAAMLALARRHAPRAKFQRASLFEVAIPGCSAVTAIGEPLNYQPSSPRRLDTLFKRVHAALLPGGVFVFDLMVTGKDRPPMNYRTWRSGAGWVVMVDVAEQPSRSTLRREIIVFRDHEKTYRKFAETHSVRLYDRVEISRRLRTAGFTVRALDGYGRYKLGSGRCAFVARKRR